MIDQSSASSSAIPSNNKKVTYCDYESNYIKNGILRSLNDPSSTCLLTVTKQQQQNTSFHVQNDHDRLITVVTEKPLMNPTRLRFEMMRQLSGMPVVHYTQPQVKEHLDIEAVREDRLLHALTALEQRRRQLEEEEQEFENELYNGDDDQEDDEDNDESDYMSIETNNMSRNTITTPRGEVDLMSDEPFSEDELMLWSGVIGGRGILSESSDEDDSENEYMDNGDENGRYY